jgi:hypothetical protein
MRARASTAVGHRWSLRTWRPRRSSSWPPRRSTGRRVLLARGRVVAVRRADIPGNGPAAAILRLAGDVGLRACRQGPRAGRRATAQARAHDSPPSESHTALSAAPGVEPVRPRAVAWSHVPLGGLLRQSGPSQCPALRHAVLARRQSRSDRLAGGQPNAGGIGLGCYGERETPGLYRSVAPGVRRSQRARDRRSAPLAAVSRAHPRDWGSQLRSAGRESASPIAAAPTVSPERRPDYRCTG